VAPTARRSCGLGAGRHDNQFGDRDHALDRHGDRRRRIDDCKAEALLAQNLPDRRQPRNGSLGKGGEFGLTLVPPIGQRTLRIDVDQDDRARARPLGLHSKVAGQGGLARSALLRCQCQYAQSEAPQSKMQQTQLELTIRGSQIVPNFRLTGRIACRGLSANFSPVD
jgi:hypothetical protein